MSNGLNVKKNTLNVKKAETITFKSRRKKYVGVIKLKFGRPISFATFASHLNYSSLVWTQNSGFIKRLIIHQKRPLE